MLVGETGASTDKTSEATQTKTDHNKECHGDLSCHSLSVQRNTNVLLNKCRGKVV